MQRFSALEYLKIDIANNFGLDKLSWADRIAWFDHHEHEMGELLSKAAEPALFYAGCKAYNDAINGVPSGYMISLDATSSGLQLLAALTGDRQAAELCNVVPTGNREDAYTTIYQRMLGVIGEDGKITREQTKEAIMCSLYASVAMPKKIFGEGQLLDVFYDTMLGSAPGAWELKEAMLGLWNSTALSHDWVLPDNFHVHIKVMDRVKETIHFLNEPFDVYHAINQPTKEGRSLGANTVHSIDGLIVREMTRRCDYDMAVVDALYDMLAQDGWNFGFGTKTKDDKLVVTLWQHYLTSGYLSARIIPHLNESNMGHVDVHVIHEMLETLPERPFKVISIHD
jgi:S-ribosylhomocysteine lyase LuxS involved in autoinducer biosynthesis